jgi:membrane complex biogenesis BtpA family protein
MNMFRKLFPSSHSIIGMIALPPLLGYPEFVSIDSIIERALTDLDTLQGNGVDGVCIENDYDRPHQLTVGPEIVASFTRIAQEVVQNAKVPVGIGVLLNDWRAALAIAKVVQAKFVRLDFFVDKVRIKAGIIDPEADWIIAYRKKIQAENVALFTDLQVKHSELLEPGKSLSMSAKQAMDAGSDALVVSGNVTGDAPTLSDLREVREAAADFPVFVGSGTTAQNVGELFRYADGAIVGTSLKNSMAAHERIVPKRVAEIMSAVLKLRGGSP